MSPRKRSRSASRLRRQAGELAAAVPQVVALRLARMATAGPLLSTRDRREFTRMGTEKIAAFQESWAAMFTQALQLQQQTLLACWRAAFTPWTMAFPVTPTLAIGQWASVLSDGMAPVHRRAVANARRLTRARRLALGTQ